MENDLPVTILLVDDQPSNLLALEAVLSGLGQQLVCAASGAEALKRLLDEDFALILLDVQMPDMDGLETAALIRQRHRTKHIPIIFLTAYEPNDALWLKGYSLGAVDFLFKPIVPDVLLAKVRVIVELQQKTEQVRRQTEKLKENQLRESEQRLLLERQRWEMERLSAEADRERRHAEELAAANREIQERDRRKDEFLAMLAHELRNPLAPVRNALHILGMGGCNGMSADQARQMAQRQVANLARLVDDLLDVSRISRGKITLEKKPLELGGVVARAVESVQPLMAGRSHQLEVHVPPYPLWLDADAVRLEQILVNLLQNAAKFTLPGGRISLHVELEEGKDGETRRQGDKETRRQGDKENEIALSSSPLLPVSPSPRLPVSLTPGFVAIRVRDNGIGISPEMLRTIFELFVQADRTLDRSQGGLGIGLTLVKSLVELHGGSIEARSEGANKGSEFVVRLPMTGTLAPDTDSSPLPGHLPVARPRKVLVVDDNVDAAQSLALLLKSSGHDVQTSHDGVTALESARDWMPEVVLLDIGLPRLDGYEVARRLRQDVHFQRAVVVALTGYGQEEDRRLSKEAGFDAHLTKPIDLAQLESLLAGNRNGS